MSLRAGREISSIVTLVRRGLKLGFDNLGPGLKNLKITAGNIWTRNEMKGNIPKPLNYSSVRKARSCLQNLGIQVLRASTALRT
jgi:hypothetical protein